MRTLALAAVVVAVALLAGVSRAGGSRSLAVSDSVESLSAAGGHVAILVGQGGECGKGLVWMPATGTAVGLKDPCSNDGEYSNLTLAGDTAIWWDYDAGNHVYCSKVYVSALVHPAPKDLGICDGTAGDTYYEFAGDRTLVTITDYQVCQSDCTGANGKLLPDGNYGVEVRRVKGGKVAPLLKPVDFRLVLDARNWRLATIEPTAVLTVYDAAGKKLWSVAGVKGASAGWIVGNTVVLQQGRAVRVYSATGAGPARPLPKGAHLAGVAGDLAVYTVGSSVRILRLADGRDRNLVTIKHLDGAQITPVGVFYAADVPVKGGVHGLVTFVTIRAALQILR